MAAEHTGGSERGIGMDWYARGSTGQVPGENEREEGRESEKVCECVCVCVCVVWWEGS